MGFLPKPGSDDSEDTSSQQESDSPLLATGPTKSEELTMAERSSVTPVSPGWVDQLFRALPKRFQGFKERPGQREFGRFCAKAINEGGLYAAEAGTGTGKTIGYLIPSSEFIRLNSSRQVIVASSTKNLMTQIMERDFGRLLGTTSEYRSIRTAILKGKSNYLCTTALFDLLKSDEYEEGSASDRLACCICSCCGDMPKDGGTVFLRAGCGRGSNRCVNSRST